MPINLIRYDGVNDPQQNIVTIDLSAIPSDTVFTIDILYSCRNLDNPSLEQGGLYRYINTYKYTSSAYTIVDEHLVLGFYLNISPTYEMTSIISGSTLYLDLVGTNTDTTVLFDCKLEY